MTKEWEIIMADERHILEESVEAFIDNIEKDGFADWELEVHYSTRNMQWEALVTYR